MALITSQGIVIKLGTNVIGRITSFSGPDGSATVIDTTDLSSAAKEKMMGLRDEGSFSADINFDYANLGQKAFIAARAAQTRDLYTVLNGVTEMFRFNGYATGITISGDSDAIVTGKITVEIDGAVTWPV